MADVSQTVVEEEVKGHAATSPQLNVLCRTREQVQSAILVDWLDEITLDFLEVQGLKQACKEVQI